MTYYQALANGTSPPIHDYIRYIDYVKYYDVRFLRARLEMIVAARDGDDECYERAYQVVSRIDYKEEARLHHYCFREEQCELLSRVLIETLAETNDVYFLRRRVAIHPVVTIDGCSSQNILLPIVEKLWTLGRFKLADALRPELDKNDLFSMPIAAVSYNRAGERPTPIIRR